MESGREPFHAPARDGADPSSPRGGEPLQDERRHREGAGREAGEGRDPRAEGDEGGGVAPAAGHGAAARPAASPPAQPLLVRVTHWVNLVLLVIMAGSGLRILVAYPYLGEVGAPYAWYPLQGVRPPDALTIGGWLAGARHWHFAFAWLFVANALVYVGYVFASGEWRRRLFFPRRDARNAWGTLLHDLRLRREAPAPVGLYNGLQRLAYTGVLALAPLLVLSGLAMYKPVQLQRLTALLGGYDAARAIHLLVLAALALFTVVHVVQVLLHPRTLVDMTVGGRRPGEAATVRPAPGPGGHPAVSGSREPSSDRAPEPSPSGGGRSASDRGEQEAP